MQLLTPDSLHYPVTVTRVLCKAGDDIKAGDALFSYEYKSKVVEFDDEKREDVERSRSFYSEFQSEYEGKINSLRVRKGHIIEGQSVVAEIDEPCKHETQYGGICADCGRDMTTVQYNSTTRNTDRATVNTAHSNTELRVSLAQASKADEQAKRRLLNSRKLSLVVDLDQTIIHATVDPTVGEWQKDPENPNYEAVKDVRAFQLMDDAPGARGCWYYIKLRPDLAKFLERISKKYELHIYTMGTRAYAENIAKIIDPDRSIFGDRILSRDESGSLTAKNLKRLFPVDTKMVLIIDDRGDVWHWSPNLVKVVPYDFFIGIGDINSSFLPKRPELEAKPPKPAVVDNESPPVVSSEGSVEAGASSSATASAPDAPQVNGTASPVDRLVSMAGTQDEGSIKVQSDEQDEAIAQQLADRPLLQMQKILDAKDEEAKTSPAAEEAAAILAGDGMADPTAAEAAPKYRHNLLQDDDNELFYLGRSLGNIHRLYFEQYDKDSAGSKGGRIADIRHGHSKKRSVDDLDNIPDAAAIASSVKQQVLAGVHIVFSGVIPIGVNIQNHDTAIWAKSFGATVSEHITKRTTHVIASPERRTAKVRQAAKNGRRVHIVSQAWLFDCFTQWDRVSESLYKIHSDAHGPNGQSQALPDSFEGKDELVLSSSEEEAALTEDDDTDLPTSTPTPNGVRGGAAPLEIETDTEELSKYAPTTKREDVSPTADEQPDYWADINDEMEEYLLGSDDDDDDNPSDAESTVSDSLSGLRILPKDARKRKRDGDAGGGDTESGNESSGEGSRLQKRKREALVRTTSLTQVATASTQPSPRERPLETDDPGGGEDDEDELDLEAALAAEMERQSDDGGEEAEEHNDEGG